MQSIVQPTKMLEQIDFLSQNARYFWKCASECIGRMSFSHKAETLDQNGRSGGQDIIFLSHFTFSVTVQKIMSYTMSFTTQRLRLLTVDN